MIIKNKTKDPRNFIEQGRTTLVQPGETHETRFPIQANNIWEIVVGTESKKDSKSKKETKEVDNNGSRSN